MTAAGTTKPCPVDLRATVFYPYHYFGCTHVFLFLNIEFPVLFHRQRQADPSLPAGLVAATDQDSTVP